MKKFIAGVKVKLPRKGALSHAGLRFEDMAIGKQVRLLGQDFVYVKHRHNNKDGYVKIATYFHSPPNGLYTNEAVFRAEDLELYNEKTTKMRKFQKGNKILLPNNALTYNGQRVADKLTVCALKPEIQGDNYVAYVYKDYEDGDYYIVASMSSPYMSVMGIYNEKYISLYEKPKVASIVYTREYIIENNIHILVHNTEEHNELNRLKLGLFSYSRAVRTRDFNPIVSNGCSFGYIYRLISNDDGNYNPIKSGLNSIGKRVEASEIINSHKQIKTETMSKAQLFIIKGKNNLIKSIIEDLKEIEYEIVSVVADADTCITNNHGAFTGLEQYKRLFVGTTAYARGTEVIFTLPAQYTEALEFAKAQLALFVPEYKVGDVVVITNNTTNGFKNNTVAEILETPEGTSVNFNLKNDNDTMYHPATDFRIATPAETEDFKNPKEEILTVGNTNMEIRIGKKRLINRAKATIEDVQAVYDAFILSPNLGGYIAHIPRNMQYIRIGCDGEDNRVSLNELATIIKTYQKFNS